MVRIAHISDSHLGNTLFQLVERKEDVRKCLRKAVRMAMRQSPDILVHTGDLFDNPLPSMEDLNFAMELFKSVQDKVEVFLVHGNHDIPFGYHHIQSPITSLETAGVVKSTGKSDYKLHEVDIDGKKTEIHLISWTRERSFQRKLNDIIPETNPAFLFAHHIPVPKERLPIHFNYYGCGHAHSFWLDEEYDIGRPGSTCYVNWNKEIGGTKKLIVIDSDKQGNEYTTEQINDIREFKFPQAQITGMGPDEVNSYLKKILEKLSPKKDGSIIIVRVNGTIDSETENGLDRVKILQHAESKLNSLFVHIEPNWECYGPRDIRLNQPLNIETSIRDYVEQTEEKGLDELMDFLGRIMGV
ncbi:MAG: DNA double-strand break repair protein Mre11 [Candidatus Thorarchaeota archaeon]|nr:MAG: DNA double-strand break repair protein Mre11 [Candidatus Thorarchaeota archaeon]